MNQNLLKKAYEPLLNLMEEDNKSAKELSDDSGVSVTVCYKIKKQQSMNYSMYNMLMFCQGFTNDIIMKSMGFSPDSTNELFDIGQSLESERKAKCIDSSKIANALGISTNSLKTLLDGMKRDIDLYTLIAVNDYIKSA